jgi:anti-sigma-K factor RskA
LKHERVTEEVRELAALYALGALTQHEARSFEIHLPDCPVCKAELTRLEHAVAGIGLSVEETETPEYLRDLLLARIEHEPQASVSVASPNPTNPASNEFSKIDESRSGNIRRGNKLDWGLRIICIALVLTNLLAFIKLYSIRLLSVDLQTQLSASAAEAEALKKQWDAQIKNPGDFAQILEAMRKPGMRVAWIVGQPAAPSASGTFFWDTEQHRYLLMGSFPPSQQGKAYQLWLVTPTTKVSAGLIKANPDGPTYTTAPIPEDMHDVIAVGITLEPESGSPTPTTRFCALGHFN